MAKIPWRLRFVPSLFLFWFFSIDRPITSIGAKNFFLVILKIPYQKCVRGLEDIVLGKTYYTGVNIQGGFDASLSDAGLIRVDHLDRYRPPPNIQVLAFS